MPLPKRNPGQEAARRMIRQAFEDLEKAISPTDSRDLKDATLEGVQRAALDIEDQLGMRSSLRNMRRLQPLFDGLGYYSKSIEVLCNGTPYLPWLWAPIKLILKISSDFIEAFEKIIKGYAQIGESLKRFAILHDTFRDNVPFQQTLAVFYADILGFHKHAYVFVRRNCWKLLFLTSWGRFQRRFDNVIEDLKNHGELIDKEASAHHIAEARQSRQKLEAWRQDSLAKLRREEEEETANQLQAISTWLRIDESDQIAILDKTAAEGSKYPGTCSWVLRNSTVASWLQSNSETPFLWFHGNPGTGKSVISSQIVGFLRASHNSLVVTHFCTYSYASSTEYEKILRSLVLQLVRVSDDLISHIYWEHVISKKSASMPALERLLLTAATTILSEPGRCYTVHILIDGLDEIEAEKQRQVVKLMSKITHSARSGCTMFKVLISCRMSPLLEKLLQRKSIVSLGEEKEALENAVGIYASQRLEADKYRLAQLSINDSDISNFARIIARKADGMFLWARLVLDYLSTNMFHNREEFMEAINTLPRKLSEFYERILVTIISKFDSRSIERFSRILGWIAFAKRPLSKAELRSAISFAAGNPELEDAVPLYIFDMCAPLIEERRDTTLCFIHVSVKDYLESPESKLPLSEGSSTYEHFVSCITCLLSGLRVFRSEYPEEDRRLRVLKGIHSFHIYANEYWVDYIISVIKHESVLRDPMLLSTLRRTSQELESLQVRVRPQNIGNSATPAGALEPLEGFEGLHRAAREVLESRSRKSLRTSGHDRGSRGSKDLIPIKNLAEVLTNYQYTIQLLLAIEHVPELSEEELGRFKIEHHQSAFTCRWPSCPRVTLGFETEKLQLEHEATHAPTLKCPSRGCQYPPFPSLQALKTHKTRCHSTSPRRKQVRRVTPFEDRDCSVSRLVSRNESQFSFSLSQNPEVGVREAMVREIDRLRNTSLNLRAHSPPESMLGDSDQLEDANALPVSSATMPDFKAWTYQSTLHSDMASVSTFNNDASALSRTEQLPSLHNLWSGQSSGGTVSTPSTNKNDAQKPFNNFDKHTGKPTKHSEDLLSRITTLLSYPRSVQTKYRRFCNSCREVPEGFPNVLTLKEHYKNRHSANVAWRVRQTGPILLTRVQSFLPLQQCSDCCNGVEYISEERAVLHFLRSHGPHLIQTLEFERWNGVPEEIVRDWVEIVFKLDF